MARAQRLNIFLMKEDSSLDNVVREDAKSLEVHEISPALSFVGRIWVQNATPRSSSWQNFVQSGTDEHLGKLLQQGASALVSLYASNRLFCLVYGNARHWLVNERIERRFGMLVTLNTVHEEGLRSLDREEFESVTMVTRSQTSVSSSIDKFGLDVQRDLVRSVTGRSVDQTFATQITGSDNLIINTKVDFSELGAKCDAAFQHYKSDRYKQKYAWIDNFQRIADAGTIRMLDQTLVSSIQDEENQNVFLSPPELIDAQRPVEYRFPGERKGSPTHPDLRLSDLIEQYPRSCIDLEFLKSKKIKEINLETSEPQRQYAIYEAVIYEIRIGDELFALSRGEWYKVAQAYVDQVRSELSTLMPHPALQLPAALPEEREGAYNERVAQLGNGLVSLDQKLVEYGGGRSKIEICDLLGADRNFIHVKAKTKSSALSHLFAQGLVSAQVVRDKKFRELASKVCCFPAHKPIFDAPRFDPSSHSVTYAVITSAQGELRDALPFFSQQSLVNASQELRNMGYSVWLNKIPIKQAA